MTSVPAKPSLVVDDLFVLVPDALRDAPAHRRFALDAEAARFFGWTVERARTLPDAHYAEVVARRLADWANGTRFSFVIRSRTTDEAVGTVELRKHGDEAEVSFFVVPELRGRGLASKALNRALQWGVSDLGLRSARLTCDVANGPSRRVADKAGFTFVSQRGTELHFRRDLTQPVQTN